MLRPLSTSTERLIESLYKPTSFWEGATRHKVLTLALIGQAGEPSAIPDLVPLLRGSNHKIVQAAADAIGALAHALSPGELLSLDQSIRDRSPYRRSYPSGWAELSPGHLGSFERFGQNGIFLFGIATFHSNGHIREEALLRLGRVKDGAELPFLLLRLNDWVREVRVVAQQLVHDRLSTGYAPFFVNNLALVIRLRFSSRESHQEVILAIETFLKGKDGQPALVAGLASRDKLVSRACYRLGLETDGQFQRSILEKALSQSDPEVRLQGVKSLARLPDAVLSKSLLSSLLTDRCAPVRRNALQIVTQRFSDSARLPLERALLDPHPSIREYAQFQLGTKSGMDLRRYYLDKLVESDHSDLYSAIAGVGETGAAEDSLLLLPYARHETSKIRRAILRALARLDAEQSRDIFQAGLADHISSVSREAMKGMYKTLHMVDGGHVWSLLLATRHSHVRRNALSLISRLSKWESIGYLVEALRSDDEQLQELAGIYIRRWCSLFNSSFTNPTNPQLKRLVDALELCRGRLEPGLRQQITLAIRSFC